MVRQFLRSRQSEGEAFDMTPVIDVVFLLIIFFMLVCQFITAERFKIQVPEQIGSSAAPQNRDQVFTLTVIPTEEAAVRYAVGPDQLDIANPADIASLIVAAIDDHYRGAAFAQKRIVRLRCDKSVAFGYVRPVLEGISKSCATDVDWAVRNE